MYWDDDCALALFGFLVGSAVILAPFFYSLIKDNHEYNEKKKNRIDYIKKECALRRSHLEQLETKYPDKKHDIEKQLELLDAEEKTRIDNAD